MKYSEPFTYGKKSGRTFTEKEIDYICDKYSFLEDGKLEEFRDSLELQFQGMVWKDPDGKDVSFGQFLKDTNELRGNKNE